MIFLDLETYSEVPIKHGTYKYAEYANILLAVWAIDDGPVQVLDCTDDPGVSYDTLKSVLANDDTIVAHNAMFDRTVLRLGAYEIDVPIPRWRCAMVKAIAHALPGSLAKLCQVLNISEGLAKTDGSKLINLFCKPLRDCTIATKHTHPAQWDKFVKYAIQDVIALREVWRRTPSWNYRGDEVGLWHLDQRMNDYGVQVDMDLAHAALVATEEAQRLLKTRIAVATNDEVGSATQRDVLIRFLLAEYGFDLPDLTSATVDKLLKSYTVPEAMKDILRIRASASRTSTAKYTSIVNAVNADGRLRGMIQFNGAGRTRRAAGRTVQLQNLPSKGLLPQDDISTGVWALKWGLADIFEDVMLLTASTIRACLIPGEGMKMVAADLANIEGRALAWLSGEEWKLKAFREFDEGTGPDIYKLTYANAFHIPHTIVTSLQRQIGKVMELALGYQGGISAFVTFALAYGIDLDVMAKDAWGTLSDDAKSKAGSFLDWMAKNRSRTWSLKRETAIVCECFKTSWREAHPNVVSYWSDMERGFRNALHTPGKTYSVRGLVFICYSNWMRIELPSGRYLTYPFPEESVDGQLSYMGTHQFSHQWVRINTYAGKLVENIVQSVSRDFMFDNIRAVYDAGFELVFHVHDELVAEAPVGSLKLTGEYLAELMSGIPPWGNGMPLKAKGKDLLRYGK